MTFEPGELIGGRYELGRQLGAGGMARVYLGHDRLLDREVAVKVLAEPYASDPQFVERFRREASAAAGLNHPNIVAVYDRGEADGSYYIVMEYLSGPDLKQVIRRRAPLPPLQAIDYTQQILAALGAAHRRDIVHRDVKPQNVLVAEDGHLKVTDFGIARAGAQTDMTEAGSVIGTAQYLSPEQARGDEVTAASDCYAVGIVLYEMLTGRVPFDGDRPVAVAMKQISDEPTPARMLEPSIPPELEAVVMRALVKRPSERYRTADEFSRALAEARTAIDPSGSTTSVMPATAETQVMDPVTGPTRVAPPPPPDEPPGGGRRRRWPWIVAGIVLLAAAIVAGVLLLGGDDAKAVTIPPVAGQSAADAQQALEDLGLTVTIDNVTDSDVAARPGDQHRPPRGQLGERGRHGHPARQLGPGPRDRARRDRRRGGGRHGRAATRRLRGRLARGGEHRGRPGRRHPPEPDRRVAGQRRQQRHHRRVQRAPERERPGRPQPQPEQRRGHPERRRAGGRQRHRGAQHQRLARHGDPPGPRPDRAGAGGLVGRPGRGLGAAAGDRAEHHRQHRDRRPDQAPERRLRGRHQEVASSEPAGTVVSSDPPAGTSVSPGSTITISVSSGSASGRGGGDGQGEGGGAATPGGGTTSGAQPPPP